MLAKKLCLFSNDYFFVSADDFQSSLSAPLAGGLDAFLSGEDDDEFFDLHIVKHYDPQVRWCLCYEQTMLQILVKVILKVLGLI